MPKDRYRLYHVEKAKGGIALTMTAGSAVVSPDSPAVFGNLLAYKDEIVTWMRRLSDDCHAHGAAVMIQLTHLGRRTDMEQGGLAAGAGALAGTRTGASCVSQGDRRLGHRAHHRRLRRGGAAHAGCRTGWHRDRGLRPSAGPVLVTGDQSPHRRVRRQSWPTGCASPIACSMPCVPRRGPRFIVGIRMVADEAWDIGLSRAEGIEIARRIVASGTVDFLNVIRGHMDTDAALRRVIPIHGMTAAPHLDFAGEVRDATRFPVFHAARIQDVATARHAIAAGKLDMVGMTRAHIADPHIGRLLMAGTGGRDPPLRRCHLLPRPYLRRQ